MSHLESMGLKRAGDKTVKGYGLAVRYPDTADGDFVHAHVAGHHDINGTVFTIFRNPRDTLISCARYMGRSPMDCLRKYYSGLPFVDIYCKFLPWLDRSDAVFWFEDMEKTRQSITYSGSLTNWREWWDDELESEYVSQGGLKLERRLGYG